MTQNRQPRSEETKAKIRAAQREFECAARQNLQAMDRRLRKVEETIQKIMAK